MNVRAGAKPQGDFARRVPHRTRPAQMPAVRPIEAPDAVDELPWLARIEGYLPSANVFREVGGIDECFPVPTQHLVGRQPREFGPLGV